MNTTFKRGTAVLGGILALAILTATAGAQCGNLGRTATVKPQAWQGGSGEASLLRIASTVDPITGFWKITLTANGTVIDHGFAQWHADGTELMNSSRPPMTGSFCMGTWK